MIITTTVKPFYGTTTRGSGLNRLIKRVNCRIWVAEEIQKEITIRYESV